MLTKQLKGTSYRMGTLTKAIINLNIKNYITLSTHITMRNFSTHK